MHHTNTLLLQYVDVLIDMTQRIRLREHITRYDLSTLKIELNNFKFDILSDYRIADSIKNRIRSLSLDLPDAVQTKRQTFVGRILFGKSEESLQERRIIRAVLERFHTDIMTIKIILHQHLIPKEPEIRRVAYGQV